MFEGCQNWGGFLCSVDGQWFGFWVGTKAAAGQFQQLFDTPAVAEFPSSTAGLGVPSMLPGLGRRGLGTWTMPGTALSVTGTVQPLLCAQHSLQAGS